MADGHDTSQAIGGGGGSAVTIEDFARVHAELMTVKAAHYEAEERASKLGAELLAKSTRLQTLETVAADEVKQRRQLEMMVSKLQSIMKRSKQSNEFEQVVDENERLRQTITLSNEEFREQIVELQLQLKTSSRENAMMKRKLQELIPDFNQIDLYSIGSTSILEPETGDVVIGSLLTNEFGAAEVNVLVESQKTFEHIASDVSNDIATDATEQIARGIGDRQKSHSDLTRVLSKLAEQELTVHNMRDELSVHRRERAAFKTTILGQQERLQNALLEIESLKAIEVNFEQLKPTLGEMQQRVQRTQQMYQQAQTECTELKNRIASQNDELLVSKNDRHLLESLQGRIRKLGDDYRHASEQLVAAERELEATKQSLKEAIEKEHSAVDTLSKTHKKWSSDVSTLRLDLDHARTALDQEKRDARQTVEALEAKCTKLVNDCVESKSHSEEIVKSLENRLKELESEMAVQVDRCAKVEAQMELLRVTEAEMNKGGNDNELGDQIATRKRDQLVKDLKQQLKKAAARIKRLEESSLRNASSQPRVTASNSVISSFDPVADGSSRNSRIYSQASPPSMIRRYSGDSFAYERSNMFDSNEDLRILREMNQSLMSKIAEYEETLLAMRQKVSYLEGSVRSLHGELEASRTQYRNHVRRVQSGALIEHDAGSLASLPMRKGSGGELLVKMEVILKETMLENEQLAIEKEQLGQEVTRLFRENQALQKTNASSTS